MGRITEVGICANQIAKPVYSLVCYLFIFGLIPVILIVSLTGRTPFGFDGAKASPLRWTDAAPFLTMFAMAPTFGISTKRLFIESYPLIFPLAAQLFSGTGKSWQPLPLICIAYNVVGHMIFLRW
jgi:hypothetical protein